VILTCAGRSIQPIQPLKQCIPPSKRLLDEHLGSSQNAIQAQRRWIRRHAWETEPAIPLLPFIGPTGDPRTNGIDVKPSAILAVGKATDIAHMSGSRDVPIVAIPHGESGNILRLMKPRLDNLGWEGHAGVRLRVLNANSSEDAYFVGDGGEIQQVAFASDSEGTKSWLALRKAESTTILRPLFHRVPVPSEASKSPLNRFPPSRLNPNPILTLPIEKTGSRPHADVSFNPWYVRQFAVVDQGGYWSIWDIEGQRRKRTTFEARPGKSGHIFNGSSLTDNTAISASEADGWARVLWVGVSMIVVCDRRHISVVNLTATPKYLRSPELITPGSTDWILEVKRNPVKLDQIFVLTTSHIFWLQISPVLEGANGSDHAGARILLSHRHFRDGEDESVKIELLSQEDCK
jgi:RNA polymerase I-specific transcription initiation factor RRN6